MWALLKWLNNIYNYNKIRKIKVNIQESRVEIKIYILKNLYYKLNKKF